MSIYSLFYFFFFFFNDTATTEIYTLSLHDALPILQRCSVRLAAPPASSVRCATSARPTQRCSSLFRLSRPERDRREPNHSKAPGASTEGELLTRCEHCLRMSPGAFPSLSWGSEYGRGLPPTSCHGYANLLIACNATVWRSSPRILHRTMRIKNPRRLVPESDCHDPGPATSCQLIGDR